ncbi:hypothetical protein KAW65_04935 [candidate division WOR-3 bacterium]|nr:hypothetical protein [candidate division WOR-3 bacterium]
MMYNEEIMEIRKKLEEHEKRISKLESLFQTKPETVKKKLSIGEFILSKKPHDDVQKTLAIGYYLEKYETLSSFNVKDLEKGFEQLKKGIPENINYKVIRNINQGYITEVKEKKDKLKAWALTDSGEKYVESNFKKGR